MNYFSGLYTVADIKAKYHKLAFEHHPDLGGSTETMQDINTQYHTALEACNKQESVGSDGKKHTYYYSREKEQAVMDKIDELLQAKLDGCTVQLIGSWVWITGETKIHSKTLKALKCRFHSKRMCWYWHPKQHRTRYNNRVSLYDLARIYGYKEYKEEDTRKQYPAIV